MTTQKRREGDGLPPPEDLGRSTSGPLVEVRTVLSRAQTALFELEAPYEGMHRVLGGPRWTVEGSKPIYGPPDENGRRRGTGEWTERVTAPHPQGAEMVEAMRKVVELLEPWERTGR